MAMTPYNRALDLLSARAYSAQDLRRKLIRKEVPPEEADAVIERLTESGLLNDAKFAESFARSKMVGSGTSRRRVTQELARKGIRGEMVTQVVDSVVAEEEIDTRVVVERVARKKLVSMGDLEPLVVRRRLYAFLARKGYDLDEIQSAMRLVLAEG